MASRSFAVRDLRNSTAEVIAAALDGHDVTITVNGSPKVRLVPVESTAGIDNLLTDAAALRRVPSSSLDELYADKQASIAAES